MTLKALERLLCADKRSIDVLETVRATGPKGAYVAAGFVRNRYWDSLYKPAPKVPEGDVDVVYFDSIYNLKTRDMAYEASLKLVLPGVDWQVRNQARMHSFGDYEPFSGVEHALRHWSETATAVGVRLSPTGSFEWLAPFGFDDLFGHTLCITPAMKARDPEGYDARIDKKKWLERWPNLKVIR
ncbi:MAG: nucleotidyltransferase family protein [Alphaproteobacteria bacterium]|nr:nucleotidyltransferase family protein [Alphaproteobacteria bacterium]